VTDPFRVYEYVGKDGYPPEWHETIKYAVRAQAGHRCERCLHPYVGRVDAKLLGVDPSPPDWSPCDDRCHHRGPMRVWTTEGWAPFDPTPDACGAAVYAVGKAEAAWRVLTVHHLTGNKLDCRWFNLVALCQRDHLYIQRRVVMDRSWPWEHSEWFKPHVAGFYASKFLGEELTRQQAIERLDELLSLGMAESAVERMPVG
jgi:hypothetical protein